MADRPSLLLRRLRALLRPLPPGGGGGIEGFVDGCVAGEIRGWALDRRQPGRRVHVLAVSDGRVVAEALADISRADLLQDGRGDGRHAFRLRLPTALLDGEAHRVQVRAVAAGALVRLLRGEIEIGPADDAEAVAKDARSRGAFATVREDERPAPAVILALWPGADEAAAGWASQVARLGSGEFDPAMLATAHTVIFARPGDRVDPAAADLLVRARPLADVVTWDGAGAASRRPEARAIGVLLGETLDGAFALRGQAFTLAGAPLLEALAAGDRRGAELVLAGRRELRWSHLPGPLTVGAAAPPAAFPRAPAPAKPERIALAVWPAWGADAAGSLEALIAHARPETKLEALVEASGAEAARALIRTLGRDVAVRPVDAPAAATAGAWLAALTAAASADAVIVCQAGVRLCAASGALEEIAAWASAPGVGAATIEVRRPGEPLAGLALVRSDDGWTARSAFSPELRGAGRPVLAAPAAFLAIGRDRLAMLGGPADDRLLAGGADLDLGLRLRRIGLASVLLGDFFAEAARGPLSGELSGAAMAAFDAAELAAAAAAFPAPGSR